MKYTEILLQPNAAAKSVMAPDPIDTGDTAWLLAAAALVSLMVPSLAIFYGGLGEVFRFASPLYIVVHRMR